MGQMIVVVIGQMSVTSELICADGAGIIQKGFSALTVKKKRCAR